MLGAEIKRALSALRTNVVSAKALKPSGMGLATADAGAITSSKRWVAVYQTRGAVTSAVRMPSQPPITVVPAPNAPRVRSRKVRDRRTKTVMRAQLVLRVARVIKTVKIVQLRKKKP